MLGEGSAKEGSRLRGKESGSIYGDAGVVDQDVKTVRKEA